MTVRVIAEAGVNHNGDSARALAMVDAAADAGADAVKFQTFRAENLARANAPKAPYQAAAEGGDESQLAMLKRLEFSREAHRAALARCHAKGIAFLSTPFDLESLDFLVHDLGVSELKLGSSEITNGPMLVAAGRTGLPVILSTGMSTLAEVAAALGALAWGYLARAGRPDPDGFRELATGDEGQRALRGRVVLMQCTTAYPAPVAAANLRAMATMADAFGLPVGFSDHTPGNAAAVAAVALGAVAVEKHFTLDRRLPGPDHRASLEPAELAELVRAVRDAEAALGDGIKQPQPCEAANMNAARRSLTAARAIRKGERFDEKDLAALRPAGGLSPMEFWTRLGQPAARDYRAGEAIEP
jgi:N-acetylneuraminate synthase